MLTRIKYAMVFLMVFVLLPIQVKAEESEEYVGQVVNEDLEETQKGKETDVKDEALLDDDSEQQEEKTDDDYEQQEEKTDGNNSNQQEEYEVPPNETTGTEFSYSVVPSPNVEIIDGKWKVIKDKKYVLSITITNNSSSDWEEVLVKADMYSEFDSDYNNYYKFLSFYPQNGVTVRDYRADGGSPYEIDAEAVVALLKSGESITLQAEVVIPANIGDAARLYVGSELYPGAPLGGELFDLIIVNEKQPVQENPKSESGTKTNTKTVAKTNDKGSTIKTAAKTGDNSSTFVYFGAIALSALTIILSRKKIYK